MAIDRLPPGYQFDPQMGVVYRSLPSTADDLTQIRGIETREAVALNRLGVYFFGQLAKWQDHHIEAFAAEMGMSPAAICREQWVEQACSLMLPQPGSGSSPHLIPAPGPRTAAVLVAALLIGCLTVYWLNRQLFRPMTGVLAADITSLHVPADSRLLSTHVAAGDRVFTGEALITLEKLEHLELIDRQEVLVRNLQDSLKRAEAQATLDLEWRMRELDRELSEVRARAEYLQKMDAESGGPSHAHSETGQFRPVSGRREVPQRSTTRPNSLLFISGRTDASTLETRTAQMPRRIMPRPVSDMTGETTRRLQMETRQVAAQLQRLEEQKNSLPEQVRLATGVESLRLQHTDASRKLERMQALSQEVAVLSPGYGTVGQVRYRAGDRMLEGDIMLRILHTDRRYVTVHAPIQRLNELQPGAEVKVLFPGDDEDCAGIVANVPMLSDDQPTEGRSFASVRVEPIGRLWPELPIGSQVRVVPK